MSQFPIYSRIEADLVRGLALIEDAADQRLDDLPKPETEGDDDVGWQNQNDPG
jgi:hypothetical protein